MPMVVVFHKRR